MVKSRKEYAREYLNELQGILDSIGEDVTVGLDKIAALMNEARRHKKTIFTMGNGGSASTASHFTEDLAKGTVAEGMPRFRAICLADSIPSILAYANDMSYEDIFVEQLKNFMEPGDIVIGLSGSGNSMNVIKAIEYANENGGITVGISGYDGGKLLKSARENIHVPSFDMQKVEDIHLMVLHLLFRLLRDAG
jgi:D-sedoheptulose 7-phosphate isomerase